MEDEDEIATKFFSACNSGDSDTIRQLLQTEPYVIKLIKFTNSDKPNARAIAEKTIYAAALRGHYDVLKALLKADINPNVATSYGTPMYAAVKSGSLKIVQLLIEFGADYRSVKGGFSPLFTSCIEGHLNILKYLVALGANIYAFDNPPLVFTACSAGQLHVMKYFLEEMDFQINRTASGESALKTDGVDSLLYYACQRNKLEIASYLVKKGAYITQTIITRFTQIIKHILHQKFRPTGKPNPIQFYHARLKELGLTTLPWSILSDYSKTLTRLELRENRLTSLPEQVFQMESLRVLELSNNSLSEICSEEVQWKCFSLQDFDAGHNNITYIPSGLFKMPELTNMILAYNLLTHLPGDPEDPSAQSTSGIPSDVRWECTKLKKFDVAHNRLRALPDTFNDLHRLGIMQLSHNCLKELPQSCSWGCINLVQLDASHNQLNDLPLGSANYWMHSLERLHLSHNFFTEISRNITELSHLTILILSNNRIRYLPPTSYWTGSRLNKLDLSYNQLTVLSHLSEEEQQGNRRDTAVQKDREDRPTLMNVLFRRGKRSRPTQVEQPDTGPGDEHPRELPVELWSNCLQTLQVQGNQILWLPAYLGNLSGLTRLDISGNSTIRYLPLTLGKLRNCWELTLNGVKIENVPNYLLPGVARSGSTKQLLAYLRAQLRHSIPYNRMKLMAVGLQGRGKTTLLSVLRNPNQPLPKNVSTVGVVVADWTVSPPAAAKPKKGTGAANTARHTTEVVFNIWDMAGQEVYYATHQCFLSRNTLYLVVWNVTEGEKGIDFLRPWLLNIQARAPHSPVIIVGTHIDKLPAQKLNEAKTKYKKRIKELYAKPGYPHISAVMMVSCVSQEGVKDLQDRIYYAAVNAKDPDTKGNVIGQPIPSSYEALQKKVAEEVEICRQKGIPPVLNQKEFAALAESIEDNDITDPEELSLAAQFLHDNGVLLHYNDHLRGLNNLYFIDPIWLADMLAEVVTVPERQSFVHNGILKESNVAFIFRDNRRFPSKFFHQYLQLLERFEIALSLGNGQRLIPSMLPIQRPVMTFVDPPPVPRADSGAKDKEYVLKRDIPTGSRREGAKKTPRIIDGMEVVEYTCNSVRRRYQMAYIPSGFWSRLISRLIINLKRSGLMEQSSFTQQGPPIIYWRRGIVVLHSTGRFLVESIQSASNEMSGVGVGGQYLEASAVYVGEGVEKNVYGPQGVDITVWTSNDDFAAMGYVVDQIDSLIDEWFPGLNDFDVAGDFLVQRQVLWTVPQAVLDKNAGDNGKKRDSVTKKKEAWSLLPEDGPGEMVIFRLEKCATEALVGDTIECKDYNVRVPLSYLVPDILLTEMPPELTIDTSVFEFNPQDPATKLGRGGAGAVYRGKYRGENVAVKEFLTFSQAEHTGDTLPGERPLEEGFDEEDDLISSAEALYLFRDLRQEVTVLAQLSHPNIVALLGVSIRPMCMVIELAPMGSLFGNLDKKLEEIKTIQALQVIPRMPGGVLGHEISTRMALQVALALRYLHKNGIVYRDLKSDNVLVWSLDVEDPINVKLADYGIARFANPGGVKGEEGTPGYLAPEAIRRRGEDQAFDEKVDIFSYAMLLFELLTGQRPFENLQTTQELNTAVTKGERPDINEGNAEPSFPGLVDLIYDCWKHTASERPSAHEVVQRITEPGFLCRKHSIRRLKEHPLQKIDTIYARPVLADDLSSGRKSYTLWTWAKQDQGRNFSIIDVRKGVFNLPEINAPGGRVYAMAATGEVEKRIWIGTADTEIQIYGYKNVGEPQCLWTFSMKDSVLALDPELEAGRVKRVFASLANGTLCVFSRKSISTQHGPTGDAELIPEACTIKCEEEQYKAEAEDWSDPLILRLGQSGKAAKCMTFVGPDQLWCGCGNTITVVDSIQMKVLKNIPVFVKRMALVNELVSNGNKVWGVGRQLSCVMEWDAKEYKLLHIFNCNNIDPTDDNIISDPRLVEDIFDPESRPKATTVSEGVPSDQPTTGKNEGFNVSNDPVAVSVTANTPFSQRTTRRTLRQVPIRPRVMNIKENQKGARSRISSTRDLVRRRQQGSTRTTSLVIIGNTLWAARGMGDIVVIDISGDENHGKVLARLATEDSEKYGNRSYHKLVVVAGEYVVSSQWLEPVDIHRLNPRATLSTPGGGGGGGGVAGGASPQLGGDKALAKHFEKPQLLAHQAITIWEAWNHDKIHQFMSRRATMLMQEDLDDATV